jgi:hypothetical protein
MLPASLPRGCGVATTSRGASTPPQRSPAAASGIDRLLRVVASSGATRRGWRRQASGILRPEAESFLEFWFATFRGSDREVFHASGINTRDNKHPDAARAEA